MKWFIISKLHFEGTYMNYIPVSLITTISQVGLALLFVGVTVFTFFRNSVKNFFARVFKKKEATQDKTK